MNYQAAAKPGEAKDGWITLRVSPLDFHDKKGAPLANWKDVDFLCLSGTGAGEKRTIFKNLRWETSE